MDQKSLKSLGPVLLVLAAVGGTLPYILGTFARNPDAFPHPSPTETAQRPVRVRTGFEQDGGSRIRGQIRDPHRLNPEEATLTLMRRTDDGATGISIDTAPDGSFVTPPLPPATYVLGLIRTPHSRTKRATLVGLTIVPLPQADVSDVTVPVERDITLTGTFRMETDNPKAKWPPRMVMQAPLVVDGALVPQVGVTEGAAGGTFLLRNAFGPRVLRVGYGLEPDHRWWFSRVLLDAKDVTDVPTDFTSHEKSKLEVVFTQHPTELTGVVLNAERRPVPGAWVLICAEATYPCETWHSTSATVQAEADGRFRMTTKAGRFRMRAFRPNTFDSHREALRGLAELVDGATTVDLTERGIQRVTLVVR